MWQSLNSLQEPSLKHMLKNDPGAFLFDIGNQQFSLSLVENQHKDISERIINGETKYCDIAWIPSILCTNELDPTTKHSSWNCRTEWQMLPCSLLCKVCFTSAWSCGQRWHWPLCFCDGSLTIIHDIAISSSILPMLYDETSLSYVN